MIGYSDAENSSLGAFLAMERAWGPVAAAVVKGALTPKSAINIASQIANALEYIHELRIVHNGVSIQNVVLLSAPTETFVLSKLANLSNAKFEVAEKELFLAEISWFCVFMRNLFVRRFSDCITPEKSSSSYQIDALELETRGLGKIANLLQSSPSEDVPSMEEVARRVVELRREIDAKSTSTSMSRAKQLTDIEKVVTRGDHPPAADAATYAKVFPSDES